MTMKNATVTVVSNFRVRKFVKSAVKLCIPISHYRLLASKILIKNRVDRRTSGFKSILIKIETVEDSVMKPV